MKARNITISLVFLMLVSYSTYGQNNNSFPTLKNGKQIYPESSLSSFDQSNPSLKFIQFNILPNSQNKKELESLGLELIEYVDGNCFLAKLNPDFSRSKLEQDLKILQVGNLPIGDKLSINLQEEVLEKEQKNITFLLQYLPNYNEAFIRERLSSYPIEIIESFPTIHTFKIRGKGFLIERFAEEPFVFFMEEEGEEITFEDREGNNAVRANKLNRNNGLSLTGQGVTVAIGDDGFIGPHIDFKGRLFQENVIGDFDGIHGEMVAGILAGAGNYNSDFIGVAPGVELSVWNTNDAVINAEELANNNNYVLTSTSSSDGCNRGYTAFTQLADRQIYQNENLLHVFSAGNAGEEDCLYGAGPGWGNITGGMKLGKNVLAVGNLNADDTRVSNSSRGPANDGRIKPDICAYGNGQISTAPNNSFQNANGSSAAAPAITGILAQLAEGYKISNNQEASSALLKAALLNTAKDLGNKGPDFSYGWGRANAYAAHRLLEENRYFSNSIENRTIQQHFIQIPEGIQEAKIMIYWHDPAASLISNTALTNNLDITITDTDHQIHFPWKLNPDPNAVTLDQAASTGIDNLNNVEQISLLNPSSGTYTLTVSGTHIPVGPQDFVVVYEFSNKEISLCHPIGGEQFEPGQTERIYWDAFSNQGNFALEISTDNGNSWNLLSILPGQTRYYDWAIPADANGGHLFRIYRDGSSEQTDSEVSIMPRPTDLNVEQICPDYTTLSWKPVTDADSYIIYQLGDKDMIPLMTITDTIAEIPIESPLKEDWFAVVAIGDDGQKSKRSVAISNGESLIDCLPENDLELLNIAKPSSGTYQDCFQEDQSVSINIKNTGQMLQSNFTLAYQFGDAPIVSEVYQGSLPPGLVINYNFNQTFVPNSTDLLKVWIELESDEAFYNNEKILDINILESNSAAIPYFESFDSFDNCLTSERCGVSCELSQGWKNVQNDEGDQIDWRINNGRTPTYGTGPINDQNSSNNNGKYLYLESSSGCDGSEAVLLSPCFDLNNLSNPVFSFWYHMNGIDIGQLYLDAFDGDTWIQNIIAPISGPQGNEWQKASVNLSGLNTTQIYFRIRGTIEAGFQGDIAIDNFSLIDQDGPPIVDFSSSTNNICAGQTVSLFDQSHNNPISWLWEFNSHDVVFLEGTSAFSQNPIIRISDVGNYQIRLTTSNSFGTAQKISTIDYINVSNGYDLPKGFDFEQTSTLEEEIAIENPDNQITWSTINVAGATEDESNVIFINNHSYNNPGEADAFITESFNLNTITHKPILRFDLSYASFPQNHEDELKIYISTDCSETFEQVIFEKSGEDLAVVNNVSRAWFPSFKNHWRTERIDLEAYRGSTVSFKFENINDFGNNLFLDNILVFEQGTYPEPQINANTSFNSVCKGEAVLFINNTFNNSQNEYQWNFGTSAFPGTSASSGPVPVVFNQYGSHEVSLTATNQFGTSTIYQTVFVVPPLSGNFSHEVLVGNKIQFLNEIDFATAYFWDFGDGTTSQEENPVHEYSEEAQYIVKLVASNDCEDLIVEQNIFSTTSTKDLSNSENFELFPNPANQFVTIKSNLLSSATRIELVNSQGQIVKRISLDNIPFSNYKTTLNVSPLSSGLYWVVLFSDSSSIAKKLLID